MRTSVRALSSLVFLGGILTGGAAEASIPITMTGNEPAGSDKAPRLDCPADHVRTSILGFSGVPTLRDATHALPGRERVHVRWRKHDEAVAMVERAQGPSPARLHLYRTRSEWFIDLVSTCQRGR